MVCLKRISLFRFRLFEMIISWRFGWRTMINTTYLKRVYRAVFVNVIYNQPVSQVFASLDHLLNVFRNFDFFFNFSFEWYKKVYHFFYRPGLDVPYYFICPYDILEDDDYVYFKIHSSDQYLYAFQKSSKEVVYRKFPTYYDSNHQGTVTYLRSVVMDPNFL